MLIPPPTAPGWPEEEELTLRLSSDMEPEEEATLFREGVVLRDVS